MNTIVSKYDVKIKRKKIKHTYIRVVDGCVVVTTNYLTPKIYINKLIKDNSSKIEKMFASDKRKQELDKDFYLFGKRYEIVFDDLENDVVVDGDKIISRNQEALNKYVDNLIKKIYLERLNFWYNRFEEKIPVPNLKIRRMKTRWGVCNIKNHNVTLNYFLFKYDLECLDYVIVHELSHFLEGNHSSNFWKVVSKYYPNYKETRKKLRS